jgi:hypothetical protein
MSESKDFEGDAEGRQYGHPHSGKHPIPTIQSYREHRKEQQDQFQATEEAQQGPEDESRPKRAYDSAKRIIEGEEAPQSQHEPYPSTNRNYAVPPEGDSSRGRVLEAQSEEAQDAKDGMPNAESDGHQRAEEAQDAGGKQEKTATEKAAGAQDPKEKRKAMKKTKRHGGGRQVTDPVTHLPVVIHDQTEKDLKNAPENEKQPGADHWTGTGLQGASKTDEELSEEQKKLQRGLNGIQKLFPPPDFEDMKRELANVQQKALYAGLSLVGGVAALFMATQYGGQHSHLSSIVGLGCFAVVALGTAFVVPQWTSNKVNRP